MWRFLSIGDLDELETSMNWGPLLRGDFYQLGTSKKLSFGNLEGFLEDIARQKEEAM